MGLWNLIKKAGSAVYSSMKTVVKKGVEVVKKAASTIGNGIKKVGAAIQSGWKKFTGRDKEEEAEALLAALECKAREKEKEFQNFSEKIQKRLDNSLKKLNQIRVDLNLNSFRRFENLASHFSTWDVDKVRLELSIELKKQHLETVKTRNELFKIDFRNHPVSSNLKAIFTLGFLTRKRAKETLLAVQEEGHRLDFEIEKIEAEMARLSLIAESLEQVVSFIEGCHEYYQRILDELDYSVNFLRSSFVVATGEKPPKQMDPEMLPKHHLLSLECADKATRILFAIGNYHYVDMAGNQVTSIDRDFASFKEKCTKMKELQQQFAA